MDEFPSGAVNCIGRDPVDWDSNSDEHPQNLTYQLVWSAMFIIIILLFRQRDNAARHVLTPLFAEKPDDKTFLTVHDTDLNEGPKYPSVNTLIFLFYYTTGSYVISTIVKTIIYYIFAEINSSVTANIACYIAYYHDGLFAGTFTSLLINLIFSLFFVYFSFSKRPRMAEDDSVVGVQALVSIESFKRNAGYKDIAGAILEKKNDDVENENDVNILLPDSGDGMRAFKLIKNLQSARLRDPTLFPTFYSSYADKFGTGKGTINMEEIVLERLARLESVNKICFPVKIETTLDPSSDDFFKLPENVKGTYDFVVINQRTLLTSVSLGLSFITFLSRDEDTNVKKMRRNRYRNFFVEMVSALKPRGHLVMVGLPDATIVKYLREVMVEAGYATTILEHERVMEPLFLPYFRSILHIATEVESAPFYTIVAQPKESLHHVDVCAGVAAGADVEDSRQSVVLAAKAGQSAEKHIEVYDNDDQLITPSEVFNIFCFWVFMFIVSYIGFFALTVCEWYNLMFPIEMGYGNYFSHVMLDSITSFPLSMTLVCIYLHICFQMETRPTSVKLHSLGFSALFISIILGTLQQLPYWMLGTLVKYYILKKLFGIDPEEESISYILLVFYAVIAKLLYLCFRSKNEIVDGDENDAFEQEDLLEKIGYVSYKDINLMKNDGDEDTITTLRQSRAQSVANTRVSISESTRSSISTSCTSSADTSAVAASAKEPKRKPKISIDGVDIENPMNQKK
jgi:hypothetical protein